MIPQLQTNSGTFFGRYWTENYLLRRYFKSDKDLSILSFGCSTGEELLFLRALFPAAQLFGCDHDWAAVMQARTLLKDSAVIFEATADLLSSYGPFDIIICNSVLLNTTSAKGISTALWLDIVELLDSVLADDGMLQLINSNIPFRLHPVAANYQPLRTPLILGPNFADQFNLQGQHLCEGVKGSGLSTMLNVHLMADEWQQLQPEDLTDVHFQKNGKQPIQPLTGIKLPNLAAAPARALGTASYRPHLAYKKPATYQEVELSWSSIGTQGVRIERKVNRIWFDGSIIPAAPCTIELENTQASAFFDSMLGRGATSLAIADLGDRPARRSPVI